MDALLAAIEDGQVDVVAMLHLEARVDLTERRVVDMASEEVRKKRKKLNQPQTSYCEAEKELNYSLEVQKLIDDLIRKKLVDKQKEKQEKADQVETRNEAKVLVNKEELKENRVEEERRRKYENLNEDKKVKLMETLEKKEAEEKRKEKAKKENLKKAKKGK